MGFKGGDWVQPLPGEKIEELIEVERSFAHGKMLVRVSVVIMKMNLMKVASQALHPGDKWGPAEDVVVTRIETESKMR